MQTKRDASQIHADLMDEPMLAADYAMQRDPFPYMLTQAGGWHCRRWVANEHDHAARQPNEHMVHCVAAGGVLRSMSWTGVTAACTCISTAAIKANKAPSRGVYCNSGRHVVRM